MLLPTKHNEQTEFRAKNKIRFVTAASLFDGHDVSINIMRRILQSSGAEVIHLGHNRSVQEVVNAALQEDAQGVAVSSYQGGHIEYFKYLKDLLRENGADHIRIFGGGGGVIVPEEIQELEKHGIIKIFSPEDGRMMGLQGIIDFMMRECDFDPCPALDGHMARIKSGFFHTGKILTFIENHSQEHPAELKTLLTAATGKKIQPVIGITGPGGAGKSSLTDEIMLRFLEQHPDKKIAVLAVDPTRKKTGGALLGDRIRMNSLTIHPDRSYMRSLATRGAGSLSASIDLAISALRASDYDCIIVETSGTGQSDSEIAAHCDISLYVMTPEFGAPTQLEKIAMLDFADLVALNKFEKAGALDALLHVRKQYQRNHNLHSHDLESMPVYPTIAGRYNDRGINTLYNVLVDLIHKKTLGAFSKIKIVDSRREDASDQDIIPPARIRYLAEVAGTVRKYHQEAARQADLAGELEALRGAKSLLSLPEKDPATAHFDREIEKREQQTDKDLHQWLKDWPRIRDQYRGQELVFHVRDSEIRESLKSRTLGGLEFSKVALPSFTSSRELVSYYFRENLPGNFPFTAGVFPFRKQDEAPTRMFAGEGGPERTNVRFHLLTGGKNKGACRLSTAFDSVTLYGEDPEVRPDIYGKIGNSGVSVPSLDDCKRLYSGFDLTNPQTSVSMTINGPAPVILAFFFNTAIDQEVERYLRRHGRSESARNHINNFYKEKNLPSPEYRRELPDGHDGSGLSLLGLSGDRLLEREVYENIRADVLKKVRGTVQADILKEDQAQNTCIFSTGFALRMMGDVQKYFSERSVRNFYSVSISGYHIAEAGANPVTQLAFTLANGFTYVEYYLRRGLSIDDFAPNLSFFFSNGIDAEYSVIGRVARRIWAVAMKRLYGASERSQKLKYHIQTSGRSLHAREIDFNDIRTTLQALYAIYDNCNSLHTNAYDEAITTPTEESVRRALAIQLIINSELGLNKNQNPIQGAYIIEELTDLVEEAVLSEFDRLTDRGGVLGAMETMYQRSKIQEESLYYENLKHSGELPIIGVNTFLRQTEDSGAPVALIRSTEEEKARQIREIEIIQKAFSETSRTDLARLKQKSLQGKNIFEELMETVKTCTLGQISGALYSVGGSYRRNM